ncbi:MAG: 2,3-diphosphoglycerate synthetase [Actinomycetota bacterium]
MLDAVNELSVRMGWRPAALYFLGGEEKLRRLSELADGGMELIAAGSPFEDFRSCLKQQKPDIVVDLSDLPVLSPSRRLRLASEALAAGAVYRGADFEFRPPRFERVLTKPSCAIIGTGKRCGKTAVSAEMARYLTGRGCRLAVVAMGRGGPSRPCVLDGSKIDERFLLEEVEKGLHAASDHYEDALMAGVTAVGSRRCGGGMAGEPFVTNCVEAAREADGLPVEVVIMEGSGSSLPPVHTDARVCVISAAQDIEEALGFLGTYRLLISDGVIITMAEEPFASPARVEELEEKVYQVYGRIEIIKTIFRPHPLKPIRGRRIFVVCTAPDAASSILEDYLRDEEGCQVVGISHSLSDRRGLEEDLRRAGEAEVILSELKAAAVDTVAQYASRKGKEIIYFHNRAVPLEGGLELERFFDRTWDLARERSCHQEKRKK